MVMRSYIIHQGNRSGSAIVAAMLIALCLAMAGAAILGLTSQHVRSVARVRDHIQAQMIAEAGANAAFSLIKADWDARLDAGNFPPTPFSGGSYDATVTPIGSVGAVIQCIGECRGVQAEVIVDVTNDGNPAIPAVGPPPPVGAFQYAVVAGSILWGGVGQTDAAGGLIHSNGDYDMLGTADLLCSKLTSVNRVRAIGDTLITADAEAPDWKVKAPGNISGTVTTGPVDPVALPDIDLTPYYQYALANGEVYASDPGTYTPVGGVMWVEGDIAPGGAMPVVGCIIATGNIKCTAIASQTKVGDLPAWISRDGDIELNAAISHHGLVYAPNGDVTMLGGGDIQGTILCAGEFFKNGTWDAIVYENSTPPDDPSGIPGAPGSNEIGISCWHK